MGKQPRLIKIKGFTPFPHQKAVIDLVDEHPTGSIIVVKSSRQKGKSMLIEQLLVRQSINYPKTNSVIVEPNSAGCRRMMKDVMQSLNGIPIVKSSNYQYCDIEFVNGSVLSFRSSESKDGLRGISLKKNSLLAIDEASFISDDVFGIILPFCNVHNNTVLIVSTPKFRSGTFYEFYKNAVEGRKGYYLVDFGEFDTSMLITEEQLRIARETMPYQLYLNEYEGEFMDMRGNFFGDFSGVLNDNFNKANTDYYMAIDWSSGTGNDSTAIVVFNSLKEQVFIDYFNTETAPATIARIVKRIKEFNPISVTVEMNSIGKVHYDNLVDALRKDKLSVRVKKFQTTNDSKRRIIEKMATAIQTGEISILNNTEQSLQIAMYEMQKTPKGQITYNGKNGVHDDIVIADAICLDELIQRKTKYFVR